MRTRQKDWGRFVINKIALLYYSKTLDGVAHFELKERIRLAIYSNNDIKALADELPKLRGTGRGNYVCSTANYNWIKKHIESGLARFYAQEKDDKVKERMSFLVKEVIRDCYAFYERPNVED